MRAEHWNLTFHGTGPAPRGLSAGERAVWLDADTLDRLLGAIGPRADVTITFDDGNASDVGQALPLLQAHGQTATFFCVADRIGHDGYLGEDDLRRLVAAGMRIGSHGSAHRSWRRLSGAGLLEELCGARERLEAVTGTQIDTAACPFGAYDRRVITALRRHGGFTRVYTSDGGPARRDAWLQPRTTLRAGEPLPWEARERPRLRGARMLVKRWR